MYQTVSSEWLISASDSELGMLYKLLCQGMDRLRSGDVSSDVSIKSEQMINELLSPSRN